MSKKYWFVFVSIIAAMFFCSSISAQSAKHLKLHFSNAVGDENLRLDNATYKNKLGQSYTVTNFKYYISNIKLTDDNGKVFENKNGYYLISEADSASHYVELEDIPPGNYAKISFTIGVDSLHNCSGAQSGALDPINGMFWTWNTGYIFMKLEGKSPDSKSPGHIFEYHIGGYKEPSNCIRTVTLEIIKPKDKAVVHTDNDMLHIAGTTPIEKSKTVSIGIIADISMILSSHTVIDFSKLSSVTDFHNVKTIAENYKDMFYVTRLVQQ